MAFELHRYRQEAIDVFASCFCLWINGADLSLKAP